MRLSPVVWTCLLVGVASACHRAASRNTEAEPPIAVAAEPVTLGTIRGVVSATGVVEALAGSDFLAIAPEPGRVADVTKKEGDPVKAGEILVRFEFPAAREEGAARSASTKNADARLQAARTQQARVRRLIELGAASQQEMDDADREVLDAEAEVALNRAAQETANVTGQRTLIRAPFNGVVAERLHNPGDTVGTAQSDAILRVIDLKQVEVVASVPVADAARVTVGSSARGVVETKSTPAILRVTERPAPEAGASAVAVRLGFVEQTELTPGVQLGVEIDAEQHLNVPLVPAVAVMKDNSASVVYVVAGDVARKRPVVLGLIDAERAEILSGVKAGEMVVTQGQSNVRDGSRITITR